MIIDKFCEWLTGGVNDDVNDYTCIDGFVIDNELSDEEIEKIQKTEYKVITQEEYEELVDRDLKLSCLEMGGVDNWNWYGEAMSKYWEEKENA